jgi:hypothetical protein
MAYNISGFGTPASPSTGGGADSLTTTDIDLSGLTKSHDPDSLIASTTSSVVNFTATSGSNAGENWVRWTGPALVANTHYRVTIWDTAPANDRRGIGVGWFDDNQMFCAGFFNTASARDAFSANGAIAGPVEDVTAFTNASMTGVSVSFTVGTNSLTALGATFSGIDDAGNVLDCDNMGSGSTTITLSNGVLGFFARRGTNNGTCAMSYKIQVQSYQPTNIS